MTATTAFSPLEFLSRRGIPCEALPPSKMGRADGRTYRPAIGQCGPQRVTFRKGLPEARTRWVQIHECAHVIDCATPISAGIWKSHPCFLGYGRISTGIASELHKHEKFITSFQEEVRLYDVEGRTGLTVEQVLADTGISERSKNRVRMKDFEGGVRRLRYATQVVELFAEAIACAVCEPERFDAGAPGLREILRAAVGPEGINL